MKKIATLVFTFLVQCSFGILPSLFSQELNSDSVNVNYVQEGGITELMIKKLSINEKIDGKVKGFRVQIHFGSDRDKAKEIKALFMQKFSTVTAYEKYEQPNFKIRVGDFRSRIEAFKYLKEISPDFPSSFIVQDEVELKELIK